MVNAPTATRCAGLASQPQEHIEAQRTWRAWRAEITESRCGTVDAHFRTVEIAAGAANHDALAGRRPVDRRVQHSVGRLFQTIVRIPGEAAIAVIPDAEAHFAVSDELFVACSTCS